MAACRFLVLSWLGIQLFVTHLASAQQNYGVIQGRIAEGTQQVEVLGRLLPQKVGSSIALVVPVSINGSKSTWWIVDTGSPVCLIDPSFSKNLGLQTDNNVGRFPITMVSGLEVGTFRCDGIACVVRSLAALRSVSLRNSSAPLEKTGFVGVNLLAKYGGLINCRTLQVFFSPTGNLGLSREKYEQMGFTYVPMKVTPRSRLEVTGTLAGKEFSFFLDTGSFSTLLDDSIRNEINVPVFATRAKLEEPFNDSRKDAWYSFGEATDFKLASYDAKGARLGFTTLNVPEPGSTHRFAGFLGMDFLFFRSAIIDVGGRALYLKPSSRAQ
jgi:hypothetical protein